MPLADELTSVSALHSYLGIGAGEAKFLSRYASYRYTSVSIPKRRGGFRVLFIPEPRLKHLQRQLLPLLETLFVLRVPVHGFAKGRSAITNANAHQARPFLLKLDLADYFDSITRDRVQGMLLSLGIASDVCKAICSLTVAANHLPQGAPTSPLLANMVTFRMDRQLMEFAKANHLRYTRYADDITFSSHVEPAGLFDDAVPPSGLLSPDRLASKLRSIISTNDFKLNPGKLRYAGRKARKEVTGLVVNEFTNVRRDFVRNLRAGLYQAETLGPVAAQAAVAAKLNIDVDLQRLLRGRLEWIAQVRGRSFSAYRSLAQRYNALFPENPAPIDPTYDDLAREAVLILEHWVGDIHLQGTAFFLAGVGLVTAFHVLDGITTDWADLFLPHKPAVKWKAKFGTFGSKHHDLAILEHNVPEDVQMSLKPATVVERVKTPIIALGYPVWAPGDSLNQRPGHIVGRATKSLVRKVEVSPILGNGMSGGPIVNERYEVVAIVHKGGLDEQKQLGIDVLEVLKLLESSKKSDIIGANPEPVAIE